MLRSHESKAFVVRSRGAEHNSADNVYTRRDRLWKGSGFKAQYSLKKLPYFWGIARPPERRNLKP